MVAESTRRESDRAQGESIDSGGAPTAGLNLIKSKAEADSTRHRVMTGLGCCLYWFVLDFKTLFVHGI